MTLVPWRGKQRDEETGSMLSAPLHQLRTEMDRLFDRFFGGSLGFLGEPFGRTQAWMPSLDVSETDADITVRAEVPGVDAKDIDIQVSGQVLTISGEKKESTESKGENYYHAERSFGSFRRSVQLPTSVDAEKVLAEYKNGVLLIRMKKEKGAVPKRISVRSVKD